MAVLSWIKRQTIVHIWLGYVFLTSGVTICSFMAAGLIIWPFSKDIYRKYVYYLMYMFLSQFSFIGNWWSGIEMTIWVDPADVQYIGREHTVYTVNHSYEVDFVIAYMISERLGHLASCKQFAKESLKYAPILGWAWYFTEGIFLKRNWESDKLAIQRGLAKLVTFPQNYWTVLCLYLEGTRWTPKKHEVCIGIAREKGYPIYKRMLLPRTKGFTATMQQLKGKVPSIVNATVGLWPVDSADFSFMDLLRGRKVKCGVRLNRLLIEDVPCETEEQCGNWLRDHYKTKDDHLDEFLQTGQFAGLPIVPLQRTYYELLNFVFWTTVTTIPLVMYLNHVVLYATLLHRLVVVIVFVLVVLLMTIMLRSTQVKHSTTYGQRTKSS